MLKTVAMACFKVPPKYARGWTAIIQKEYSYIMADVTRQKLKVLHHTVDTIINNGL
jgi:hypothetical protein